MNSNPYAPPKAAVADRPTSTSGLKRRSVLLMIVLTIVTFALYYPLWFFRRHAALNQLNSPRKLRLWPLVTFAIVQVVDLVLALAFDPNTTGLTIPAAAETTLVLCRIAVGIMMIVQCFIIKDILEDHLAPNDDGSAPMFFVERVKLSGLMTFFFSIFYLQYIINKYIAVPEELRAA